MRAVCSEPPANTVPTPHSPAATAACSASGAAVCTIRAAIACGVMPCSTSVISNALKTSASCALGKAPGNLQKRHRAEIDLAEQVGRDRSL